MGSIAQDEFAWGSFREFGIEGVDGELMGVYYKYFASILGDSMLLYTIDLYGDTVVD